MNSEECYKKCIEDYVEIFDEVKNGDICEQSLIHYVNLIKKKINNNILKKYFNVDCDDKLILHDKPKYNDELDYCDIFNKLKEYKNNYYNAEEQLYEKGLWKIIDANQTIDIIFEKLLIYVLEIINN